MSIKLVPAFKNNLGTSGETLYTAPSDCVAAVMATGTVENHSLLKVGAKLFVRITGRNSWVINGKPIEWHASPLVLPPVSLFPGETLEMWSDIANVLDANVTFGEQR